MSDQLEDIKLILELQDDDDDSLLALYLNEAICYAKQYTHREDVSVLQPVINEMVCYLYHMKDTLGLESEGYGGVSFNYSIAYPDTILDTLKRYRVVRFI